MLNLQTHLLWASSRQHECGIKHNKLWVSLAFDHAWMSDYICMYICLHIYIYIYIIHIWICVYEFMNKVFFQTHECVSLWIKSGFPDLPFQDGHKLVYWPGHLFSYKWDVHCWFCVCSSAASSFIRKYFSQHISIKSTQTRYMYSFMAQAGYR